MAIWKTNNKFILFYILLILLSLCACETKNKKPVKKPSLYSFTNIDLEFRFIETKSSNKDKKISTKDLGSIKKLVRSVKSLLTSLIYTNMSKKKTILNKSLLDNFDIDYSYDEPLIIKPENISKHLVVLFTVGNAKTKIFKTTIYKENKNSMKNPDKRHCYISKIEITQNKKIREYINNPNYFRMTLIKEIFYLLGFRRPYFIKKKYVIILTKFLII